MGASAGRAFLALLALAVPLLCSAQASLHIPAFAESVQAALDVASARDAMEAAAVPPAAPQPPDGNAPALTQEEAAALQQQRALYEASAAAVTAALERAVRLPSFNSTVCDDEPDFHGSALVVRRATYGLLDPARLVADVEATEALQRHASEFGLFLAGDDFWMDDLFGDPYPGFPKLLQVEFSRPPGRHCTLTLPHTAPALELPAYDPGGPLPTPAGPLPPDPQLRPDVIIVSAPREASSYVHETIASLLFAGVLQAAPHINVFVGANDTSYLKNYSHHRRIMVHSLSQEEWDAVRDRDRRIRHLATYRRALEVPLAAPDGVIVLEDDVKVEDAFLRILGRAVREIEAAHQCYMLVLYSNRLWRQLRTRDFLESGGRWRPLSRYIEYKVAPPHAFYGMQAMYYPRCALRPLAELGWSLIQHPDDSPHFARWYYDSVVTFYSDRHSVPLLVLPQSPVQHFGRASALSLGWHESPTWDPA